MGKFQDITGQKFGKLTVIKRAPNKGRRTPHLWSSDRYFVSPEITSGRSNNS